MNILLFIGPAQSLFLLLYSRFLSFSVFSRLIGIQKTIIWRLRALDLQLINSVHFLLSIVTVEISRKTTAIDTLLTICQTIEESGKEKERAGEGQMKKWSTECFSYYSYERKYANILEDYQKVLFGQIGQMCTQLNCWSNEKNQFNFNSIYLFFQSYSKCEQMLFKYLQA